MSAALSVETSQKVLVEPLYYDQEGMRKLGGNSHAAGQTSHIDKTKILRCAVPIGHGYSIVAYASEKRPGVIFLDAVAQKAKDRYGNVREANLFWNMSWGSSIEDVDPFISVEVLSRATTKMIEVPDPNYRNGYWGRNQEPQKNVQVVATYNDRYDYDSRRNQPGIPYQFLKVRVTGPEGYGSKDVEFRFERPESGEISVENRDGMQEVPVTLDFFGTQLSWNVDLHNYQSFHAALTNFTCKQGTDALWAWWLQMRGTKVEVDLAGVKALETRKDIKPVLERLSKEEPLLNTFFKWLHDGKVREKTSNNKLISAMLESVGNDYDKLKAELRRVLDNAPNTESVYEASYQKTPASRNVCLSLMGATEKVAEGKSKAQWQFAKGVRAQAEVLGISTERHPNLMARIEAGDISLNLFHESGAEDKLVNVEFDLFERALARPGWAEPLSEICQSASRRSTYSKRVTSYIAFLFRIEKYLDRTAPRPSKNKKKVFWKAMPKFVNSQWELEMGEATEEGTTKRRSAMTPVADNDEGTITVPYVAMAVSGVRTTWCYSEIYFVAEEGQEDPIFPSGGVYSSDFVEKLNGRDDYGLCFFTLTGTSRNQGYPTFLIIFERTTEHGTRVHFHRVHPSRSRGPNGTDTPPCRLVEECYRYMAGNIRAEQIRHQQGDLLLVSTDGPGKSTEEPVRVRGFENHEFVSLDPNRPVTLTKATGKSRGNLLGWLHAPAGMRMPHPEHEPVEGIEQGWYELRRCKSWEANPTSVWVLNID